MHTHEKSSAVTVAQFGCCRTTSLHPHWLQCADCPNGRRAHVHAAANLGPWCNGVHCFPRFQLFNALATASTSTQFGKRLTAKRTVATR
jgi:hypothetical protein